MVCIIMNVGSWRHASETIHASLSTLNFSELGVFVASISFFEENDSFELFHLEVSVPEETVKESFALSKLNCDFVNCVPSIL